MRDTETLGVWRTYGIAVQGLEKINGLLEEIWHFLCWGVGSVAFGLEGRDTGSMLCPFVVPELLVVAVDIYPVCIHIVE